MKGQGMKAESKAAHGAGHKAGHTPGPWTVNYREGRAAAQYGHNVSCDQHAKPGITAGCDAIVEVRGHSDEEARANARLIAAAPRMLEALKDLALLEREREQVALKRAVPFVDVPNNRPLIALAAEACAILREIEGTTEGAPAPDVQGGES